MSDEVGSDLKRAVEEAAGNWADEAPVRREVGKVMMHRERLNGHCTIVIAITAREFADD